MTDQDFPIHRADGTLDLFAIEARARAARAEAVAEHAAALRAWIAARLSALPGHIALRGRKTA